MKVALIGPGDVIVREVLAARVDTSAGVRAGYKWLPVVVEESDVSTGPDVTIDRTGPVVEETRVLYTRTRRDMTAQELSDSRDDFLADNEDTLQFKVLFNHENRVRVLESKAPLTPTQFRAALKAQM